ncbi:Probable phiRv1 integrase [Alloactinosynnema sp. L-07]|uniref:recombinase family protein n=1 Tax=Alloactinosynnema sp. L-07 TaxID=1653480 RepID=UPI00065F0722|nr:recombinase family protein [Alloactinosynnema sp. L-07]CRK55415.1 Probable phiRv1 integrase [Alloactinosynnema sp. L-07]
MIYARASADKAKSVEDQADECVEFCEDEGFEVVEILRENDRSASRYATKDRPKFARVLRLMRAGSIDILVTWENSRAQRELKVYVNLREMCEEFDVLWAYGGSVYDMRDPADRKATAQDAVNSEAESDNISGRVSRGVRKRAKSGLWHGPLQYGYRREYDKDTGEVIRQVVDPATGAIVREIVDRLLAGHSVNSVVKELNGRGVPCPRSGQWGSSKVRHLALNPAVAGKRTHHGLVIGDGQWPALITAGEQAALAQLLGDPSRRSNKDGTRVKHLLSGIAVCDVCDSPVGRITAAGFESYACRQSRHVVRHKARVDAFVVEALLASLETPDAVDVFKVEQSDVTAKAIDEARTLRLRLNDFYKQAARGGLSPAGLAEIEAELLPSIAAAERKAQRASLPPVIADLVGAQARSVWADLELTQRRSVIRAVMRPRIARVGKGGHMRNAIGVKPNFLTLSEGGA